MERPEAAVTEGQSAVGWAGLIAACLVISIGTAWAFERAAPDFKVFYAAWRLVLDGRGADIYRESPDRFLYAPGFAWLFAPLGWLPREAALALWCFAKAAVVGFVVREFQPLPRRGVATLGLAAWGVVLLARPLLIDFQYGQVNTLILGACCWALLGRASARPGWGDFARWFLLAVAATAKVFPLPLLAVPWLVQAGIEPRRLRLERAAVVAGLVVTLAIPAVSLGPEGAWSLLGAWREALVARAIPYESHNQSFGALLHRWFSGAPVHVVALGMEPIRLGWRLLSFQTLRLLSLAWVFATAGALLAWLLQAHRHERRRWVAVLVALMILPSHLVWKPYFVLFLPIGVLLAGWPRWNPRRALVLAAAFAAMNLSGFDLLGGDWGARAEAASVMLWAALTYLALGARDERKLAAQSGAVRS